LGKGQPYVVPTLSSAVGMVQAANRQTAKSE